MTRLFLQSSIIVKARGYLKLWGLLFVVSCSVGATDGLIFRMRRTETQDISASPYVSLTPYNSDTTALGDDSQYSESQAIVECLTNISLPPRPIPIDEVSDFAGVLADTVRESLRGLAKSILPAKLAIVTLRDIGSKDVDVAAREIGNSWGIGDRGTSGIVVLLIPKETSCTQYGQISIQINETAARLISNEDIAGMIGRVTDLLAQGEYGQPLLSITQDVSALIR